MTIPSGLYNLIKAKPPIAWYPFCEGSHTTGYTPDCGNETDGATLELNLRTFLAGEYCGGGLLNIIPDANSGDLQSALKTALQISGDFTIIMVHEAIDTPIQQSWLINQSASGETPATNVLYELSRLVSGELRYFHEYGNGSNVETLTSVIFPVNDGIQHFLALRRDTSLKRYETKLDDAAFVNTSYSDNPTNGESTKLNIPISGASQSDGTYRNIMIFNRKLTDDEITTIKNAGYPDSTWFDYSNWNSATGLGYVTYNTKKTVRFTDASKGLIASTDFDFGDGSAHSTVLPVDHEYDLDAIGSPYTVDATLVATDTKGKSDTITKTIDLS